MAIFSWLAGQDVKSMYENALTPVTPPTVAAAAAPRYKARRNSYDLERVRQELADEQACLMFLRCPNISPYFESMLSCCYSKKHEKVYQILQHCIF